MCPQLRWSWDWKNTAASSELGGQRLRLEPGPSRPSSYNTEARRPTEPLKQRIWAAPVLSTPGPSPGRGRAQVLQIAAGPYHTLDAGT